MSLDGPVTRADGEAMRAVMEAALDDGFRCYLIADMSGCTGIDAEARKYMSEWSRDGAQALSGVATYGVGFTLRAVLSLTMAAIRFLGREQIEVVFVRDEAEALKWVDAQRDRPDPSR